MALPIIPTDFAQERTHRTIIATSVNEIAQVLNDLEEGNYDVLLIPDGTVSAPGIAFASEPGTGWYRSAALQASLAVNGSERIRVVNDDANTNTGILLQGHFRLGSIISPAQITSDQNDYNPTDLYKASAARLTSDASRNITGIVTPNLLGRFLWLFNVGAQDIVLVNASASSTAAYRFAIGANITIGPDEGVGLWYDVSSMRWRAFGKHV